MSKPASLIQTKRRLALATSLVVLGLVLTATGLYLGNQGVISADTLTTTTATANVTGVTPPTPADPTDTSTPTTTGSTTLSFPVGWSMVNGQELAGRNLTDLNSSGVLLYSYNDPYYPATSWTIFPGLAQDGTTTISLQPVLSLGYYAYNPSTDVKSVTLDASTPSTQSKIFGRGWHLFYWNGTSPLTKDDLMSQLEISYSDGTVLSGTQAISADTHEASIKVYIVVDPTNINLASSVKELTGTDSSTTVSKLPPDSYYWFYLRRTKERATSLDYLSATPSTTVTATASSTSTTITPPVPQTPSATASAN